MTSFTSGAATLFVEKSGVSIVEYEGPSASSGERGGPVGTLERFVSDANTHKWVKEQFGEENLRDAIAEARRLLAGG
jgi:hypothetical protein